MIDRTYIFKHYCTSKLSLHCFQCKVSVLFKQKFTVMEFFCYLRETGNLPRVPMVHILYTKFGCFPQLLQKIKVESQAQHLVEISSTCCNLLLHHLFRIQDRDCTQGGSETTFWKFRETRTFNKFRENKIKYLREIFAKFPGKISRKS